MLKVLGHSNVSMLSEDQRYEWIDLTGKEVMLAETEKDGVFSITLDLKPQGAKKTSTPLLALASIAVASEVSAKYAEVQTLEASVVEFVKSKITPRIEQVSRYVDSSLEGNRVIDITNLPPIGIKIYERVDRDNTDAVRSSNIVADIDEQTYIYSPAGAGVFDLEQPLGTLLPVTL